ncbi:MAG: alanine--glyoxylate aminotransferase family protein [bacterium]|nr:alanine--glyoxylate aminotransferase family protein [bacterium]
MELKAGMTLPLRKTTEKLLMGPGPSNADQRVLKAIGEPMLGHLDPDFLGIMNETRELLKYVFQTKNELTMAMPGTGSAGMEAAWANTVLPGMKVIICVHGVFGQRMTDVASRYGANVIVVSSPMGKPIDPADLQKAIKDNPDAKIVGIVHAETSTGVLQPLDEISKLVHDAGMYMLVDCVTSLGGVEVPVDKLKFDMTYSGTQKCLNCPPGLAPLTVSPRMGEWIRNRALPVKNWYLDLNMITRYWGEDRFYHHTAPINMTYALNEALRVILEEGNERRWERHWSNARLFWKVLEAMGLELVVEEQYRLPSLTTYYTPDGVNEAAIRKYLMDKYNIEIGGGLGELKGKIHRVGLMGVNSNSAKIALLTVALCDAFNAHGYKCDTGAALEVLSA